MIKQHGFTLIELIVFIVVAALAVATVFPIVIALKNIEIIPNQTKAQQLIQGRMELILEQRIINGFSTFTDPCTGGSPPAACTPPSGYTVSAAMTNWNGDPNYTVITVTVTGSSQATLTSLVAHYD